MNINYLWNSTNQKEWEMALSFYYSLVKPSNMNIEKELDNLDSNFVKNMTIEQFYNFLHDKYFVWKYTQPNRLKTTRTCFEKYLRDNNMFELKEIHKLMFEYNPENIEKCLRNVQKIKGLGIAGASGLLSLLFPGYFGTVDQFVVQRLLEIENFDKHSIISKMKPESLSLSDGVILIEIMKEKAQELNTIFKTKKWTPRKIDKILWSIDRQRLNFSCKRNNIITTEKKQPKTFIIKKQQTKISMNKTTEKEANRNSNIEEAYRKVLHLFEKDKVYERRQIINILNSVYHNETSVIPSDYCYNRINLDIAENFEKRMHVFVYVKKNNYRFVGENYSYTGDIKHKSKRKGYKYSDNIVGRWENGNIVYLDKDKIM